MELQKIGSHEISTKNAVKPSSDVDLQKYKILAMAVESESTKKARSILDALNVFRNDDVFNSLYYAVLNLVVDKRISERTEKN